MPPPQPRVNEKRNFQKNFENFLNFLEFLNFCYEKFGFLNFSLNFFGFLLNSF